MTNSIETTAITTTELANILAEKTGSTKKAAKETIQIVLDTLTETLVEGKEVRLSGIGILSVQDTAERNGVNPSTGEKIVIPASKRVAFKTSKTLKDAVRA